MEEKPKKVDPRSQGMIPFKVHHQLCGNEISSFCSFFVLPDGKWVIVQPLRCPLCNDYMMFVDPPSKAGVVQVRKQVIVASH